MTARNAHEEIAKVAASPTVSAPEPSSAWREYAPAAVLLALCVPTVLFGLDRYSLVNGDEEIYHVVARGMVERGDFIRLQFYDEHRVYDTFMNAPLQYWARAGVIWLFGSSLFSMRILTALFAIGSVLMTYRLARHVRDDWKLGFVAGLVQLTTLQFVYLHGARTGELEPVVLLLYTAIALLFLRSIEDERSFAPHHIALVLLFNVKSPTLLIPLLAEAACFALLPWTRPALSRFVRSALWILPLGTVWHVSQMLSLHSEFLAVMNEMAEEAADHAKRPDRGGRLANIGFYLRTLLFGAFPWSLLYPFALASPFLQSTRLGTGRALARGVRRRGGAGGVGRPLEGGGGVPPRAGAGRGACGDAFPPRALPGSRREYRGGARSFPAGQGPGRPAFPGRQHGQSHDPRRGS